jgi:DUF971 family protein
MTATAHTSSRINPTHVEIIGAELAIVWNDGLESFYPLENLRRACPCAVCQGEADVLGAVERPERVYQPSSFEIRSIGSIGGYALQPVWQDGHSTGLFSFSYLRQLGAAPEGSTSPAQQ